MKRLSLLLPLLALLAACGHGPTAPPAPTYRVYISNESESILDVVDRESAKILKKVALSGHPNNLTITKDGGRVLVGIREDPFHFFRHFLAGARWHRVASNL